MFDYNGIIVSSKIWTDHWRGKGGRTAKRHRDPAISLAREQLNGEVLQRLLAAGLYDEIVERLQSVLNKTNLVTKKQLAPLSRLSGSGRVRVAAALVALQQDDVPFREAHARYIEALSEAGADNWPLSTAPIALLAPDEHVCVAPATFRRQAQWTDPDLKISNQADARTYQRLAFMAHTVRAKLNALGHQPRDMFDVVDFMWSTLRPSAIEAMADLPKKSTKQIKRSLVQTSAPRDLSLVGYVQSPSAASQAAPAAAVVELRELAQAA